MRKVAEWLKANRRSALEPINGQDLAEILEGEAPPVDQVAEARAQKKAELQKQIADLDAPPAAPAPAES